MAGLQPSPPRPALLPDDPLGVSRLEAALVALEARVSALERAGGGAAAEAATPSRQPVAAAPSAAEGLGRSPSLAGRALIALAGAYLFRALAETGTLETTAALALGLAYAAAWLARADLEAARGERARASVDLAAAALMTYPLAGEAALRFGVDVAAVAVLLAAITAAFLRVSVRRRLPLGAWTSTLGAVAVAFTLGVAARAVDLCAAALLAVGVMAYITDRARGWTGVAGVAAVGADALLLAATFVALQPAGPPPGYSVSVHVLALGLVLLFPAAYLGLFALASIVYGCRLRAFEIGQGALSLSAALALAAPLARTAGVGTSWLGAAAAFGAVLAALAAWALRARARELVAWACASFALAWAATSVLLPAAALAPVWTLAAIAVAAVARRSTALAPVSVAALVAAGLAGGVLAASLRQVAGSGPLAGPGGRAAWALALSAAVVATLLPERPPRALRVARTAAAGVAVLVLGGEGVGTAAALVAGAGADPGALAALRSVVTAALAVALALLARGTGDPLAGRWMRIVLAAGAAKLIAEDLPRGRALTLVVGLAAFGAALLLAPALERRRGAPSP